jgi:uncharacterized protein (DUF2236 family)
VTATADASVTRAPEPANDFDVRPFIFGTVGNLAGPANVIMQLSWPGVGYGVVDSPVESGSAMKHPVKRARTTFTYLAVAFLGSEDDRKAFRRAVTKQHVQVKSAEGSPVEYSAMDPHLQLWVAACLYYGAADVYQRMHGGLDDASADAFYRYAARMGTTLQVRQDMWPADRDAFAAYWKDGVAKADIDDKVRRYLDALVRLKNMPRPLRRMGEKQSVWWTTGFLPPEFRAMMRYEWTDADEAKFTRRLRRAGKVDHKLPDVLRLFPFNLMLWDLHRRIRKDLPLV